MKIVILIDTWFPQIGGGQVRCLEVARRLARDYGCLVEIVTRDLGDGSPVKMGDISRLKITKLGPRLAWDNLLGRLFFLVSSFFYALTKNYDIIHAYSFLPGTTAKLLALIKQRPVVFTVIGSALGHWSQTRQRWWRLKERLERFITLTVDYDYLITDNLDFLKLAKNKKIALIVNGIEITKLKIKNEKLKIEVKDLKYIKLLFVGRLHPQKGLIYLLKAFRQVINKFPQTKLVIVGYGKDEKMILAMIKKLNLSKTVEFKGRLIGDDLIKEYQSAQLLVIPSLFEGHPLVMFDAWLAKIPVVATKVGTIPQFVKDGINGYLVRPGDVDDLDKTLIKAIENPNLSKMGEAGFKMIKNKYSWDETAKKVYFVYKNCL